MSATRYIASRSSIKEPKTVISASMDCGGMRPSWILEVIGEGNDLRVSAISEVIGGR